MPYVGVIDISFEKNIVIFELNALKRVYYKFW